MLAGVKPAGVVDFKGRRLFQRTMSLCLRKHRSSTCYAKELITSSGYSSRAQFSLQTHAWECVDFHGPSVSDCSTTIRAITKKRKKVNYTLWKLKSINVATFGKSRGTCYCATCSIGATRLCVSVHSKRVGGYVQGDYTLQLGGSPLANPNQNIGVTNANSAMKLFLFFSSR